LKSIKILKESKIKIKRLSISMPIIKKNMLKKIKKINKVINKALLKIDLHFLAPANNNNNNSK
jgi:hypothetical protein